MIDFVSNHLYKEIEKMAAIIDYLRYNDKITNKKCCELTEKSTATAR